METNCKEIPVSYTHLNKLESTIIYTDYVTSNRDVPSFIKINIYCSLFLNEHVSLRKKKTWAQVG